MRNLNNKAYYKHKSIASVEALARALGYDAAQLHDLAKKAPVSYRVAARIKKQDGSERITYDAYPKLKELHGRLLKRILREISFPGYLQGGIKDISSPRDYVRNAGMHSGAVIVINHDISNFFPSVSERTIYDIWHNFFRFTPTVAELLTRLTSLNDGLPQGSRVSNYLANLVFWSDEPILVEKLHKRGITYSRLTDDITLSARYRLSKKEISWAIAQVHGMLGKHRFKSNRSKQKIYSSGERMIVNKVVINRKASLPHQKRSRIRAAVWSLEKECDAGETLGTNSDAYLRAMGLVTELSRFHPQEGLLLRERLKKMRTAQTTGQLSSSN